MKIGTILDQIDLGSLALPEFQRGYVWNREQVRGLMDSLYRKHPVGSLLVWVTATDQAETRGDGSLTPGSVKLLLDGQQRITSLYGIIRGKPPQFFDGNAAAFMDLYFNLDDEIFEFYGPVKMKDNPAWISVTDLFQRGIGEFAQQIAQSPNFSVYLPRISAITQINEIDLHIEEVTGKDKTVDTVVEIFNRVNSGGTKLSKGDLALARICAQWPDARDEMKERLKKWRLAGFDFQLDWLLRSINTVVTGEALFSYLGDVDTLTFQIGLSKAEKHVDTLLNLIAGRLGLDHDRVLGGRSSLPLLVRYVDQCEGRLTNHHEQDKLLYWYVHAFLWGRYAGSTESILDQDLALIESPDGALDRLIDRLRQSRGHLRLRPDDFQGWSKGARFYPLLYMLSRTCHAKDWGTGIELTNHLLGHLSSLQLHHIFPKALLYEYDYSRPEVNALANFTFLTQDTNLVVSNQDPAEYLQEIEATHPGVLETHWIPMDRRLWRIENYPEFLSARRELLAAAANGFLDSLLGGERQDVRLSPALVDGASLPVPGHVGGEDEEVVLLECLEWVSEQGLPNGHMTFELADPNTGSPLAVLDLAWPDGLQPGYSQPVALLIDEPAETLRAANHAGFRCFTDASAFREYVRETILAEELIPA